MDPRGEFGDRLREAPEAWRYNRSKLRGLLGARWPELKELVIALASGNRTRLLEAQRRTVPHHLEIHVTERCNLNCEYCRGGLRDVPPHEHDVDAEILFRAIRDAHALNPEICLRFSGTIGEPCMHPKILEIFRLVNELKIRFTVTTNGTTLSKPGLTSELLRADHVHISLDATNDADYRALKGGHQGEFERVVTNVERLATARTECRSSTLIVVSVLLQANYYRNLPVLSARLKAIGVDTFEVKMQHFDARRTMTMAEVEEAYGIIDSIQRRDSCATYAVVKVQSLPQALNKTVRLLKRVPFDLCAASALGLSTTIDPLGHIQSCCHYFLPTLGSQGELCPQAIRRDTSVSGEPANFPVIWHSDVAASVRTAKPRKHCLECSPSDLYINDLVAFLQREYKRDPSFLDWVESQYVQKRR